jgi:Ca2+-transporting ATPase
VRAAHKLTAAACADALDASEAGLSEAEAQTRLQSYGENQLPEERPDPLWLIFAHLFFNPLIYILLAAGAVTIYLEEHAGAIFIFAVLIVNAIIGTIQEYSASAAASALRNVTRAQANVWRDGTLCQLDAVQLVPGDRVALESGNKVPADLRLMQANELRINESLLTGESDDVLKDAQVTLPEHCPTGDRLNMAFAGSMVSHGRGVGMVVATGMHSQIGAIASHITQGSKVKSPLIIRMERFTKKIALIATLLIVVIASVLYLQGEPPKHIFMIALGLAVAAIPEGLPVTLTIALSIGMRRMAKRNVIVRKLPAVEALGSCTLIASDKTGTLTQNELSVQAMWPADAAQEEWLYRTAVLANEATLACEQGSWCAKGDAVDCALLMTAHSKDITREAALSDYPPIACIPYESEQKCSASIHQHGDKRMVFMKGALETLLPLCPNADRAAIEAEAHRLSGKQYRVLAFAYSEIARKEAYALEDVTQLSFAGLAAMSDPLRAEAAPAIAACRAAGIEVAMITGDHPDTALAIARELQLAQDASEVVTGATLGDADLTKAHVFARVEPNQKLDIVNGFIEQGHFVAVTGDGVNDAPALRHAHVGIAMGQKGTDVARESADIILTDDNFASIVSGVEEGRSAYNNIRNIIFFLISTSFAEICMFLGAILLVLPIPLFATQLLWLNFVTSIIQDIALTFEPPEGNELKQPPRKPDESIFNRVMIQRLVVTSSVMGLISLVEFYWMLHYGGYSEAEARNLLLLQFVLFENVIVLNCRSETQSIFSQSFFSNPLLLYGTLAAQLLHIAALYLPFLSDVLYVSPVSLTEWLALFAIALIPMAAIELEKAWRRRQLAK